MSETINTTDVEFDNNNPEGGTVWKITCPACKDVVYWASHGWWDTKCQCGFTWTSVEIIATGTRYS